jgi:hypothetical protein
MDYWMSGVHKLESVLPMEGPMAVPIRAAIGSGLGYLVMEAVRPGFAYTPDGQRRPDAVFPGLYQGSGPPTYAPFWTGPLVGALVLTTMI